MKSLIIGCVVILLLVVGINAVGSSQKTTCEREVAEKTHQASSQVAWACE